MRLPWWAESGHLNAEGPLSLMATMKLIARATCAGGLMLLGPAILVLAIAQSAAAADPKLRWIRSDSATSTSAAVVVDAALPLVHTTQLWPEDEKGRIVGPGDAGAQAEAALDRLEQALRES